MIHGAGNKTDIRKQKVTRADCPRPGNMLLAVCACRECGRRMKSLFFARILRRPLRRRGPPRMRGRSSAAYSTSRAAGESDHGDPKDENKHLYEGDTTEEKKNSRETPPCTYRTTWRKPRVKKRRPEAEQVGKP